MSQAIDYVERRGRSPQFLDVNASLPPSDCDPQLPLRVGISTRAIFRLEHEHAIFVEQGVEAYARHQRLFEDVTLDPGTAFEVVRRLLALNSETERLIDVVFLSRNSPDLSLRAFHSAKAHNLDITRGAFTGGRCVAPYAKAWNVDLLLSNEETDVWVASQSGIASAKLFSPPAIGTGDDDLQVRIAFEGDSVVFSDESDLIFRKSSLPGFMTHEVAKAEVPMTPGPFGGFFRKLGSIRERRMRTDGFSDVRIAIVTARNAPSHERVVRTLRDWGTPADEAHFVGTQSKAPILEAFGAHIFFDDQQRHVEGAAPLVSSGLVYGPFRPEEFVIQGTS